MTPVKDKVTRKFMAFLKGTSKQNSEFGQKMHYFFYDFEASERNYLECELIRFFRLTI